MRIAIIGAGALGTAIAGDLIGAGHEIVFGGGASAHDAAARLGAIASSNADAAAFADVVALAVPFRAIDESNGSRRHTGLDGAVLWSCVNALKPDLSGLAVGFDTSAAEEVARRAPGARVVSAIPPFAEALANGDLRYDAGLAPSVFICGDDEQAKAVVEMLVLDLGAHPVHAGPLAAARLIEPAMMLLVRLAYAGVPRDIGLRLLERTR